MRVSTIYTEMHRMSEMMERFISGTAATNQQQPATSLSTVVLESEPVQATLPPEQGYEQQLLRQDEQVHRSRMRVRKNRGGKAPRKEITNRALRRAQGIDSYEDEPVDDDDEWCLWRLIPVVHVRRPSRLGVGIHQWLLKVSGRAARATWIRE
jgi:hypothetical protein